MSRRIFWATLNSDITDLVPTDGQGGVALVDGSTLPSSIVFNYDTMRVWGIYVTVASVGAQSVNVLGLVIDDATGFLDIDPTPIYSIPIPIGASGIFVPSGNDQGQTVFTGRSSVVDTTPIFGLAFKSSTAGQNVDVMFSPGD